MLPICLKVIYSLKSFSTYFSAYPQFALSDLTQRHLQTTYSVPRPTSCIYYQFAQPAKHLLCIGDKLTCLVFSCLTPLGLFLSFAPSSYLFKFIQSDSQGDLWVLLILCIPLVVISQMDKIPAGPRTRKQASVLPAACWSNRINKACLYFCLHSLFQALIGLASFNFLSFPSSRFFPCIPCLVLPFPSLSFFLPSFQPLSIEPLHPAKQCGAVGEMLHILISNSQRGEMHRLGSQ